MRTKLFVNKCENTYVYEYCTAIQNFRITAAVGKKSIHSAEIAQAYAESVFEKYRIVQNRLFQSNFDWLVQSVVNLFIP